MASPPSLVVFSHLRWDFVFQRPQHLLTRLASQRPVIYVEEPVRSADGGTSWEVTTPAANVTVCRPHTTLDGGGFSDEQIALLAPMVRQLLADRAPAGYDLWLYTPLALPLAEGLTPRVLIYDKMDDLASFKFAPPALRQREDELLTRADIVFTGGPSLYRSTEGPPRQLPPLFEQRGRRPLRPRRRAACPSRRSRPASPARGWATSA